ncbi:MAG: TonB-dependent receptor [Rhodocyclales bacterium GT-UBC]|nr:MAG: TonB-dependent receptor [Rhodocyclales bacterium GT-UBC]
MRSHSLTGSRPPYRDRNTTFRLTPLAAAILAGLTLGNGATAAESNSVAELQAEVAFLKAALEQSRKELAARDNKTPSAPAQATSASKPAPDETAKNPAQATVLDTIVVRRKTPLETLKEVPQSVSLVSGEELDRLGANNITEVLRRVGNVNFNYGNPRTGSLTMRGITTGSSDQIDPTIGTMLDGVSLAYTPLVNGYVFTDIDSVEVTRGPQGTQGGKGSNIGRIAFKTKAPSFTPETEISQTLGDWDTLKTTAVTGGPVVDGLLAWRGTFLREQGNGPWKNQFPDTQGRGTYQNVDRTFGRVQFLLTPGYDLTAKLSVEFQPKGSEYVNGLSIRHPEPSTFSDGVARPTAAVDTTYKKYLRSWFNQDPTVWNTARDYFRYPVNVDNNGAIMTGSKGVTLNLDWQVAGHTLQSITGYRNHWFSATNDEGTPYDVTKSGGYITDYNQISQEIRLQSKKNELVDYVTGLYYLKTDNDSLTRTRYGNDAGAFNASDALYSSLGTTATGQALLKDSLNLAYKGTQTYVKNESKALYGQADWHMSEPLTLTTGYRVGYEERATQQGVLLLDPGVGSDFNAAFGKGTTSSALTLNTAAADRLAARYFGSGSTWSGLSAANQTLLKNAALVRNGVLQLNSAYAVKDAPTWKGTVNGWNLSLTDKLSEELSLYGTLQYGEKGGMAQIASNGSSSLVKKERTNGYEAGLRSSLLNRSLTVNAGVFLNDIKDFQTTVNLPDPVATAAYLASNPTVSAADGQQFQSVVGNLPSVRVKGIEVDAAYSGIRNLTLRLAAAYNDARYGEDTWVAKPNEVDSTASNFQKYYNAKGAVLNNAPKFTAKIGADYRLPVLDNKLFHASANYSYTSSYNTSASSYDVVKAYGLLDLGIGIGRQDGLFDVNLIAKNALDTKYHVEGWNGYTPNLPRWFGVVFSTRL